MLSTTGDMRIGAAIQAEGGALTSEQQIRVVGLGATDLLANPNAEEGVNIYAKGDVVFSTLEQNGDQWDYMDVQLNGMIYTQGNFKAKLGMDSPDVSRWGIFNLTGALVAYGGDPDGQDPGANGEGNFSLNAETSHIQFDPNYIGQLLKELPADPTFTTILNDVY